MSNEPRKLIVFAIFAAAVAVMLLWTVYEVRGQLLLIYVSGLFATGIAPLVRMIERKRVLRHPHAAHAALGRHPRDLPDGARPARRARRGRVPADGDAGAAVVEGPARARGRDSAATGGLGRVPRHRHAAGPAPTPAVGQRGRGVHHPGRPLGIRRRPVRHDRHPHADVLPAGRIAGRLRPLRQAVSAATPRARRRGERARRREDQRVAWRPGAARHDHRRDVRDRPGPARGALLLRARAHCGHRRDDPDGRSDSLGHSRRRRRAHGVAGPGGDGRGVLHAATGDREQLPRAARCWAARWG